MPKTRIEKEKIIQDIQKKLSEAKAIVFADYSGLKAKETEALRKLFKKAKGQYLITKKNLFKIILGKIGFKDMDPEIKEGGISFAFHNQDEILPAKILNDFSKEHKALKIRGGILEGRFIDSEKIQEIAKLPGKEELIAQFVYLTKAPLSGLVGVLKGNLRGLVCVLSKIK